MAREVHLTTKMEMKEWKVESDPIKVICTHTLAHGECTRASCVWHILHFTRKR